MNLFVKIFLILCIPFWLFGQPTNSNMELRLDFIGSNLKKLLQNYIEENHIVDSAAVVVVFYGRKADSSFVVMWPICSATFFTENIPVAYTFLETPILRGKYLICFFDENSMRYLTASQSYKRDFYTALNTKKRGQGFEKLLKGDKPPLDMCSHDGAVWKIMVSDSLEKAYPGTPRALFLNKSGNYRFWKNQVLSHFESPSKIRP